MKSDCLTGSHTGRKFTISEFSNRLLDLSRMNRRKKALPAFFLILLVAIAIIFIQRVIIVTCIDLEEEWPCNCN
jgi:hypothetical protein